VNPDLFGILYLALVRVSIIAAGIISIVCGYRLFLTGVFQVHPKTPPTEVSGRFSGGEFKLKTAAPGTCFALFGAGLIVAMIAMTPPEFGRSRMASVSSTGETTVAEELKMRGQATAMADIVEQAKREERAGNKAKAIQLYERSLRLIAEPMNNLAWLYHEKGRNKEALALAQLAIQLAPNEPEFTDTLKKVRDYDRKQ